MQDSLPDLSVSKHCSELRDTPFALAIQPLTADECTNYGRGAMLGGTYVMPVHHKAEVINLSHSVISCARLSLMLILVLPSLIQVQPFVSAMTRWLCLDVPTDLNNNDIRVSDIDSLILKDWSSTRIVPMAANIQFVFYKNPKNPKADVLVKVLLNEAGATLPLPKTSTPNYLSMERL